MVTVRQPTTCPAPHSFTTGLRQEQAAVTAGLTLPWRNGPAEGTVNKISVTLVPTLVELVADIAVADNPVDRGWAWVTPIPATPVAVLTATASTVLRKRRPDRRCGFPDNSPRGHACEISTRTSLDNGTSAARDQVRADVPRRAPIRWHDVIEDRRCGQRAEVRADAGGPAGPHLHVHSCRLGRNTVTR
jgi:hypothetical protein